MRAARALGIALATLLAAAVSAAWLLPPRLDWSGERGRIAALATRLLGRPVTIDGPVALTLLPEPSLRAGGVRIDGAALRVPTLDLRAAFWPLLAGRVVPRALVLHAPMLVLPWPLPPALAATQAPSWPPGLDLRVEDGRVRIGTVTASGIDARASVGETGALSVDGSLRTGGRAWSVTARLTAAGHDGASGLDLTVDGTGALAQTEAQLTGQFAADGSFAGHMTASGESLAGLMAAPAVPFRAQGRVTAADGLIAGDDLALDLGGAPARAAVALRLSPVQRLDLSLAAGRLNLDAWLPPLLRPAAGGVRLPVGLDISAEAADLFGARLRRLRCAFDLSADSAEVREATAVLPGDALLTVAGRISRGPAPAFAGTARLRGHDLPATARWIAQAAGVDAAAAARLPRTADLAAGVRASSRELVLDGLTGRLDGAQAAGRIAWRPGPAGRLTARLDLARLDLDPWAGADWTGGGPAGVSLDMTLTVAAASLRGEALRGVVIEGAAGPDGIVLRRLSAAFDGARLSASGRLAPDGRITAGRLDLTATGPARLLARLFGPALPEIVGATLGRLGPVTLIAGADGPATALAVPLVFRAGDATFAAESRLDLTAGNASGQVWLRADDLASLLRRYGAPAADWLGRGGVALAGSFAWADGALHVAPMRVRAGALDARAALDWQGRAGAPHLTGHLTGQIDAATLPLPIPASAGADPLPLATLRGWEASVDLSAARVLADGAPLLRDLHAHLGVAEGVLGIGGLRATLGGGALTGSAALDGSAVPPTLAVDAVLHGATLDPPLPLGPVTLAGGTADAALNLAAAGYSPAALRATLAGRVHLTAAGGVVRGVDLPGVRGAVARDEAAGSDAAGDAALQAALAGGQTPYATLAADATVAAGGVTLDGARLTGPDGAIEASGVIGLGATGIDLRLTLRPALGDGTAAPEVGLQLTGPPAAPRRTPDLAGVLRWLSRG